MGHERVVDPSHCCWDAIVSYWLHIFLHSMQYETFNRIPNQKVNWITCQPFRTNQIFQCEEWKFNGDRNDERQSETDHYHRRIEHAFIEDSVENWCSRSGEIRSQVIHVGQVNAVSHPAQRYKGFPRQETIDKTYRHHIQNRSISSSLSKMLSLLS